MGLKGCFFAIALVLGACLRSAAAADRAVLVTTDYSTGSLALVDLSTNAVSENLLNIHSDAAVRTHNDRIYVINRLGQDNVIVLDPEKPGEPLHQFSVGNGTNPQDIAFASDEKAYIARLQAKRLLIVNPATGDSLGSVDLSPFADADGMPEAAALAIYGEKLYVTCQRGDQENFFAPTDYSAIAVVDLTTDQLVDLDAQQSGIQGIALAAKNPGAQALKGHLLILSSVGSYSDFADGGIEVVDLAQNKTLGLALTETDLGGNTGPLAMVDADKGYVVISDANFANALKPIDLEGKSVGTALQGISGGYIPAIGVALGKLYVSDQGTFSDPASGGLRVFDTANNQLVAGPLNVGLPPAGIAFLIESAAIPTDPIARADFSGNGTVDFDDFLSFAGAYGKQTGQAGFDVRADMNDDGKVDFNDFLAFAGVFGKSVGG